MWLLLFHSSFRIRIGAIVSSSKHSVVVILIVVYLLLLCYMYIQVICVLHGELLLQYIHHLIDSGVICDLILLHYLPHHLVIYHHVIHLSIQHVHWLCHFHCINLVHLLVYYLGHLTKSIDQLFVGLHRFYSIAHYVHLYSCTLEV